MSLPPQIKQWTTSQDGLSNLTLTIAPLPTPGPSEVLVKINTIALNYRDTEVIMGLYNHHLTTGGPPPSIIPCSDMCGTIITSHSALWSPGDSVLSIFNQTHLMGQIKAPHMKSGLGVPLPGVLAEYRVFPDYALVRKPAYLTDEQACTLPIAGVTAWMAINGMRPLGQAGGKGETVLIQGTGGVAVAGLGIAKASGAEVIMTSSSDEKLRMARELGADKTINYRSVENWDDEVLKMTGGEGVDIIFENGGAQTLRRSFNCVAFGGLIDCIGYLSGKEDAPGDRLNTNVLALMRNVTLKGILNGPKERFEEMLAFYEEKQIIPVVDRVFAFEDSKEALIYLFKGGHFGKVVIKVA
ncbi:Zinc-type alcohol dehydrogenase-like protein [Lachnellula hyalina]|uniref:Zinc-type alcohol dehydrogenase-like protein n=1 Tax=Lachnellula hyalina TaxID=1316788 RepID=A0A8H8R2A6_9HELO|nr:Zinc-type alcohol dehydrogenase-like protein [Lachnellula hyalina]TVY27068.1 Zinc-type alcohol dehydrogenase-like protein [Lachnellula hyalina]